MRPLVLGFVALIALIATEGTAVAQTCVQHATWGPYGCACNRGYVWNALKRQCFKQKAEAAVVRQPG
jgi:hypothetical protein